MINEATSCHEASRISADRILHIAADRSPCKPLDRWHVIGCEWAPEASKAEGPAGMLGVRSDAQMGWTQPLAFLARLPLISTPRNPKPTSIIAQVAGSGADA